MTTGSDAEKPEHENVLGESSLERSKQEANKQSWTHHNTFCRKSLLWTLATLQSWQPLGFTPRTDRNCGEPGKYIHDKWDMKLTGESDPQSLAEHQACNPSGGSQGAICTDPVHSWPAAEFLK